VAFPRTAYVELMSTGGKTLSNASQEKTFGGIGFEEEFISCRGISLRLFRKI